MSIPPSDPSYAGDAIRLARSRKAITIADLAAKAGIWPTTLMDIELGKRKPRFVTMQKIARALGVPPEELLQPSTDPNGRQSAAIPLTNGGSGETRQLSGSPLAQREIRLKATRFIPCFAGDQNIDTSSLQSEECEKITTHTFPDGFAVIEIVERLQFPGILEMLRSRRERHLSILKCNIADPALLPEICRNPIIGDQTPRIEYVMSIHQLLNFELHDKRCIYAMCEPSLVGITDDPAHAFHENVDAEQLVSQIDPAYCNITEVKYRDIALYVSWSNVVLADVNSNSFEYSEMEALQVQLQKLWFQIFIYDKLADRIIEEPGLFDAVAVIDEVNSTRMNLLNFCKINSVGSRYRNQLKEALISTSQIRELATGLVEKIKLLKPDIR